MTNSQYDRLRRRASLLAHAELRWQVEYHFASSGRKERLLAWDRFRIARRELDRVIDPLYDEFTPPARP